MLVKKNNKLLAIIIGSFMLIFSWVIINNFFDTSEIVYKLTSYGQAISMILYIFLILILSKFVVPKIKNSTIAKVSIFTVILIISIFCACYFRLEIKWENSEEFTWDMGNVFSTAERLSKKDFSDVNYLKAFPNNIMITLIYAVVLKIASIFNIQDLILFITMFNTIIVYLTAFFTYKNAVIISGEKNAMLLLIILMFTTPFYLYTAIFYTDTLSMFFSMLILYFILKIKYATNKKSRVIYNLLLGMAAFFGLKVKITSTFIIIALMVYGVMKYDIKLIIKKFIISFITFLVVFSLYGVLINTFLIKDGKVNQVPVTHWILMGLKENGNFNGEDYIYTMSYQTYNEKKNADIELIKSRIKNYTIISFLKHINSKLHFAWGDGTYYAPIKLERQPHNKGKIHEFVLRYGKDTKYYKYIPQGMHLGMLVFIVIGAFAIIKNKLYNDNINIALIFTIYGLIIFLLIWENRSRYVLTILPIMMIVQLSGIDYLSNLKRKGKNKKNEENISSHTNVL